MVRSVEEESRRMLRARDAMDRSYADPLDVEELAAIACVSKAHFIRTIKSTFAETAHRRRESSSRKVRWAVRCSSPRTTRTRRSRS